MRVLVVHNRNRGVGQYFRAFQSILDDIQICHRVGKVTRAESILTRLCRHIVEACTFICLLIKVRPAVVHLNPSFSIRSLLPCTFYWIASKLVRRRVLLFIHGWDQSMEKLIERHPHSLRKLLGLADAFIVLSRDYRQALERWGIQRPVFLETTIVPDDWTKNVDLEKKLQALQQKSKWTILFLAEVIGDKGVYLAIDAIRILREKFSNVELIIAGDGMDLAC